MPHPTRIPRLGVQLPEVEREVRWPEYVAMAEAAERSGFDSIWLGDHLLYRGDGRAERGPWEAWTMLAALARVTDRVELGPLVACTAFHPPAVLAKMAATIDEISGGRFVLGLGAGWNRAEFAAFGLPYDQRVARFAEAYAVIQPLVAGNRVTHHGHLVDVDDAVLLPPPARTGGPPLMIGSNGERMLRITLPTAHRWNTWYTDFHNRADEFAQLDARVTAIAREVGRDPATVLRSACVLVVTDRVAGERPRDPGIAPLAGSVEQIAAGIGELADAGADEVILVVDPITEGSIRQLGEVVAAVRGS